MAGSILDGSKICQRLDQLAASGASFDTLLSKAVEHLHHAHPSFHWTGIYELFPDHVLRLGPFIGAPTDHVFISVGQGVCGSAVAERRDKNVPDVSKEPNYLACSSATRSELVLLIRKGDTIFAQIDIDSHELNAFDARTELEVKKVADWLADAFQSRRHPDPSA
jgi:GAF domain-containing protein